jgi:glutathione S-transferase
MKLYYHPLSSYSQKTLMAFYEKGCAFEPVLINLMDEQAKSEYKKIYPMGKVPFVRIEEKSWSVPESSIIIEYIDRHFPGGTKLIPDDPDLARQVRMRDRFFDFYVNDPMVKIFFDGFRPEGQKDPYGVQQAKDRLDTAFAMIDQ